MPAVRGSGRQGRGEHLPLPELLRRDVPGLRDFERRGGRVDTSIVLSYEAPFTYSIKYNSISINPVLGADKWRALYLESDTFGEGMRQSMRHELGHAEVMQSDAHFEFFVKQFSDMDHAFARDIMPHAHLVVEELTKHGSISKAMEANREPDPNVFNAIDTMLRWLRNVEEATAVLYTIRHGGYTAFSVSAAAGAVVKHETSSGHEMGSTTGAIAGSIVGYLGIGRLNDPAFAERAYGMFPEGREIIARHGPPDIGKVTDEVAMHIARILDDMGHMAHVFKGMERD